MKRDLPAYVYPKGAHGLLYLCRRGQKPIRLQSAPGTAEFAAEYALALKGMAKAPAGKTFAALIDSYRRSQSWPKADRTRKDYNAILDFIEARIGASDPARLKRHHVISYRDQNAARVRFANYLVQVLRILMEHAIDIGWREDNPAKGVKALVSDSPPRQPWPADLIADYRAQATGRAALIFELCLGTGQRIGDVLRMRWDHIDGAGINVRQSKTGQAMWIPFTRPLQAALAGIPRRGLTIAAQSNGRPTSYRGAADMVMAVRRQIGAEAYDLHALRHAAASELAALGCSDELIMAVTGHTSRASVVRYAGAARQKARATEAQGKRNGHGT